MIELVLAFIVVAVINVLFFLLGYWYALSRVGERDNRFHRYFRLGKLLQENLYEDK